MRKLGAGENGWHATPSILPVLHHRNVLPKMKTLAFNPKDHARNLGAIDSDLNFESHIKNIIEIAF